MRKIKQHGEVQLYLESLGHIKQNIKIKQLQIQQLKEHAENITYSFRTDFVSGGPLNGGFADAVAQIIDLQFQINTDIYRLVGTTEDIMLRIDNMFREQPESANLLALRYVNGLNWEDICDALNCSYSTTHRLHRQALQEFKNYLP